MRVHLSLAPWQTSETAAHMLRLPCMKHDRHLQEVAGQHGIVYNNCSRSEFITAVAGLPGMQTSASLLNSTIPVIGVPNNSTLLLPTDAAWTAFRDVNGALRPSASCDPARIMGGGGGAGGSRALCCLRLLNGAPSIAPLRMLPTASKHRRAEHVRFRLQMQDG